MTKLQFNQGDRVLVVSQSGWGPKRYKVSIVSRVYKIGHFLLDDGDTKWRQNGSCVGERFQKSQVEPYSADRVAEIQKKINLYNDRIKLNRLGQVLMNERDEEKAAKIWRSLSSEVQDMIHIDDARKG